MSKTNVYCGGCTNKILISYDTELQFKEALGNANWHQRTWGLNGHIKQWFCSQKCGDKYKIGYFHRCS
jgi:hypothetical protein